MIIYEATQKIAKQLNINYLSVGNSWKNSQTNKELSIQTFWITEMYTYFDYKWDNLTIFVAKSIKSYYGLLILPDEYMKMVEVNILLPVEMPDWNHPVEDALHNMDLVIEEEPVTIFGGHIKYYFMFSSSSLTSHLEVSTSEKSRLTIDNLTEGIVQTIQTLVRLYNNENLAKLLNISLD